MLIKERAVHLSVPSPCAPWPDRKRDALWHCNVVILMLPWWCCGPCYTCINVSTENSLKDETRENTKVTERERERGREESSLFANQRRALQKRTLTCLEFIRTSPPSAQAEPIERERRGGWGVSTGSCDWKEPNRPHVTGSTTFNVHSVLQPLYTCIRLSQHWPYYCSLAGWHGYDYKRFPPLHYCDNWLLFCNIGIPEYCMGPVFLFLLFICSLLLFLRLV